MNDERSLEPNEGRIVSKGSGCSINSQEHGYDLVPGMRVIIAPETSESRYRALRLWDEVTKRLTIHYEVPEDRIVATYEGK